MTDGLESPVAAAGSAAALHRRARGALDAVCVVYGVDAQRVHLTSMGGRNGGLGNAIPLPIPFRRRYLLRYHRCMHDAEPLALRGLFAHELMHVVHYSHARYGELLGFMSRYLLFLATAGTRFSAVAGWARALEQLTDLMAVQRGEGASLAAWKRFKARAIERGDIYDGLDDMYLSSSEIDELSASEGALQMALKNCVRTLACEDALHPFRKPAS
ncbi:MAG: hypothetical protein AAGL66_13945 [Pseudomonadota bacterium]